MSYLIVKWNSFWQEILREDGLFGRSRSLRFTGPPGTKACDAVGGAFRSEWREGPVRTGRSVFGAILSKLSYS